jgi:hypothetical protein
VHAGCGHAELGQPAADFVDVTRIVVVDVRAGRKQLDHVEPMRVRQCEMRPGEPIAVKDVRGQSERRAH